MTEAAGGQSGVKTSGSDASAPFVSAKANLRDTIKWLAAALAALGAATLAGSPLTGFGALTGSRLAIAVCGAGFGLVCVLLAIALTLSLLLTETLSLRQVYDDPRLRDFIDRNADYVLPPELTSIGQLIEQRTLAIATIRAGAHDAQLREQKEYKSAVRLYTSLDLVLGRILNLAHFELLRRNVKNAAGRLISLTVAAVLSLGLFAWAATPPKPEARGAREEKSLATIVIYPGADWHEMAKAWNGVCGSANPIAAKLRGEPIPGWLDVEILDPAKCKGVRLMMPGNLRATPNVVK